jgi:hypothetical protein
VLFKSEPYYIMVKLPKSVSKYLSHLEESIGYGGPVLAGTGIAAAMDGVIYNGIDGPYEDLAFGFGFLSGLSINKNQRGLTLGVLGGTVLLAPGFFNATYTGDYTEAGKVLPRTIAYAVGFLVGGVLQRPPPGSGNNDEDDTSTIAAAAAAATVVGGS